MDIAAALALLDPTNDEHWTADGLPLVDVVSTLVGRPVRRQEITDAAPELNRYTIEVPAEAVEQEEAIADDAGIHTQAPGEAHEPEFADAAPEDGDPGDAAPTSAPAVPQAPTAPAAPKGPYKHAAADADILKMPTMQVLASAELTERAWREIERQIADANRAKVAAQETIDRLHKQGEFMSMHLERMRKTDPNQAIPGIQQYLARSHQARAERAARARKFVDAGTSLKDVAAALTGSSRVDLAMARKNTRGMQRPNVPLMHQRAPTT